MSLLDRILNRTPEMKELYVMEDPKYGTFGQEDKPRVTFEALAGIKNKVGNALGKGGNFLEEALFGEVVKPAPTQVKTNADGNTIVETAINNDARKGGIIPDLMTGFKENLGEKFSTSNLTDTKDKGFIYRLGEGLGTATRFLDSPLGRGLAVAGTVGALGGSGGDALAYGLNTTAKNQGLRMQDRIYRNDLKQHEINSLMASPEFALMDADAKKAALAAVEEKYNNMGGYITGDAYKNILASRQMQENAEWRKANLMADLRQNEVLNDIRRQDLAIKKAKLEADLASNSGEKYENPLIILNNVEKLWQKMPQSIAIKGTSKGKAYQTGVANMLGLNNNDVSAYMAIAESMVTPLARQIAEEKGNISDRDITRARNMLPQPYDSYEQGMAKLNAVRNLLTDLSQKGNNTGKVGTITTNNAQPKTNDLPAAPKKIGKYTVEVQ